MANYTFTENAAANLTIATSDSWAEAITMLWRVVGPILLIVGLANNICILVVLNRMKKKCPTHLFFKALAVTDFSVVALWGGSEWIKYEFGFSMLNIGYILCVLLLWVNFAVGMLSGFLLTALTVQRALTAYSAVVRFQNGQLQCTDRTTRLIIASLAAFCVLFHIYVPFTREYRNGECNFTKESIEAGYLAIVWLKGFLLFGLPIITMTVSNCVLVRILKMPVIVTEERREISRITLTAFVVSIVFILLVLPLTVMLIIKHSNPYFSQSRQFWFWFQICILLIISRSAVNFFCYVWVGPVFRRETFLLLAECKFLRKRQVVPRPSNLPAIEGEWDF